MPYRVTARVSVNWVAPGAQGGMSPRNGQTLEFFNTLPNGSSTFTATDITNLGNTLATDMKAQWTAQIARIAGFATGTD